MKLRKFNERGVDKVHALLDTYTGGVSPFTDELLRDPDLTVLVSAGVDLERIVFPRRFEMAAYCHERLGAAGIEDAERDKGLWTWLSAFWFEQLCIATRNGSRGPGERARWVPALDEARRYYRHLVLGPYMIYRRYVDAPERALVLLVQHPSKPGDVVEQIASRPDLVNCAAAVGAATVLYCDGDAKIKRGAGGKKPGSARRLGDVLMQFDLTFDLQSMSPEQLLAVLPQEFRRWRSPEEPVESVEPGMVVSGVRPGGRRRLLDRLQDIVRSGSRAGEKES